MLFLNYNKKLFSKNKRGHEKVKKRHVGQLKNVSSCTDTRAWSTVPAIQREYMLESFSLSSDESSQHSTNRISNECFKIFQKRYKPRSKNLTLQKQLINDEIKINTDQRDDYSKHQILASPHNVEAQKSSTTVKQEKNVCDEIDNLRNMVKDLKDQVSYLEEFKKENAILRSELNSEGEKLLNEAKDEINCLKRKLELYGDIETRYEQLLNDNNILKGQYNELMRIAEDIKREKRKLLEELNKKNRELSESNSRALVVSTARIDKEILKDRLTVKDEKIKFLLNIVENQEFTIHDLTLEMQNLKSSYSYKEEKLLQNLASLRLTLNHEKYESERLENQLISTEELVKELETLRDQFRTTNCSMAENIHTYKRQFIKLRSASENMINVIQQLKGKLAEKDNTIKKLSIYPQNAFTVIYFSHLDHVLNTIGTENDQKELLKAIAYLKQLVKKIKQEMWNSPNIPEEFQINNSANQTEIAVHDKSIQYETFYSEHYVQTTIPDQFIIKYNQAQQLIKKLSQTITSLEELVKTKNTEISSLEEKLISCIEEKAIKICQVERLKESCRVLKEQLNEKYMALQYSELMLKKANAELDMEKNYKEYTNSLLINAMDSTFSEYNSYISVLQTYIDYSEKNLNVIYGVLISEISSNDSNTSEIHEEVYNLSQALHEDKEFSQNLYEKVNYLEEIISRRNDYVERIETKLAEAESTIEILRVANTESVDSSKQSILHYQDNDNEKINNTQIITYKNSTSRKDFNKIIKHYKREKKELKQKLFFMQISVKRVKKIVNDLHKKVNISEKLIYELHTLSDELTIENNTLKDDKLKLMLHVEEYQLKINTFETTIKELQIKNENNDNFKKEMEEHFAQVLKKLSKYKNKLIHNKKVLQNARNDYLDKEQYLQTEIEILQSKNADNLEIITSLQEELKHVNDIRAREIEIRNSKAYKSVQVDMVDKHKEEINKMKDHYDRVIKTIEKEYNIKAEKVQQQHLNNLKSMKEAYETDIKCIKRSHSENITKIQSLHDEELSSLKKLIESKHTTDKATTVNFYCEEIENLKQNYVNLLNEKEKTFMEKLEEIKIKEGDKLIKEKDSEIKQIKKDMHKSMSKLRKKFKSHQNYVKHLYESKVNALHDKYKSLFEKEIVKLTSTDKTVTVDQETQSEPSDSKNQFTETCSDEMEREYSNVPEKEICVIKKRDDRQYNEKKNEGDINELLIKVTQDNEVPKLKINKIHNTEEKHKIETFIEEKSIVSHNIDIIPMQDVIIKNKTNFSSSAPGNDSILLQRINDLENLLFLKNHETKRNAKLYDKKIKQEQMKNRELITLLDQEMFHSGDVQCRLGMEYNRAEQLQLEKEGLKDKCTQLEIRLQETEQTLENERAKSAALMHEIEILSTQGEHSDQLDLSLMRLRHKLDQALECEQRLTLEMKKEMQNSKKIEALLRLNEITETYSEKSQGAISKADSKLKVIFVQECGILHTWSKDYLPLN